MTQPADSILTCRRSGAVVLLVLVLIPVLLGFGALTVDVGVIYNTRADLQNAADAGALAATNVLAGDRSADGVAKARQAALDIIQRHYSLGQDLAIDSEDIVFGQVEYNEFANRFDFKPTDSYPDAVRVNMRRSKGSVNGATPLFFAWIFGKQSTDVSASSTAGLTGARDIAVVIDLSGSMKHDSYLRFYTQVPINARDVWASLDGPAPSRPYIPGDEHETEYATDTGPTIGAMTLWGNPITPLGSYNPATDPGLWYIPNNAPCTLAAVTASLTARGYTAAQRNTIMNSSSSSTWPNRVAVMIGVAEWTPSGSSDTTIGNSELTWLAYPSYRKNWVWRDYIDWVSGTNNKLIAHHPVFQFRFGLKTYLDFMLDYKDNFSQTDLTQTPEEPARSVKDGLQEMVNITRTFDHMSLEIFASTARHEIDLTDDRQAVADRLYAMQPNHYDNSTNMGAGLEKAIDELTSIRARPEAQKVIVLMSDGASTMGPNPESVAQEAADLGIKIYAISVGYLADRATMRAVAEATGGEEYFAEGTPEQYTAKLRTIFRTIGGLGHAALIE